MAKDIGIGVPHEQGQLEPLCRSVSRLAPEAIMTNGQTFHVIVENELKLGFKIRGWTMVNIDHFSPLTAYEFSVHLNRLKSVSKIVPFWLFL